MRQLQRTRCGPAHRQGKCDVGLGDRTARRDGRQRHGHHECGPYRPLVGHVPGGFWFKPDTRFKRPTRLAAGSPDLVPWLIILNFRVSRFTASVSARFRCVALDTKLPDIARFNPVLPAPWK